MLTRIRSIFAHSWVARIGAALLAVAFGAWGIQGALFGSNAGPGADEVATVKGHAVSATAFDAAFGRQLQQTAASMGQANGGPVDPSTLPPAVRREVAQGVLSRLVTEEAIVAEAGAFGLSVPDAALRRTVFDIPQFKGSDGQFDRAKFDQVLQANGLTEQRVFALLRDEMLSRAVMEPVRAGAVAPPAMTRLLFDFGAEQRQVSLLTVPFAAEPQPPTPDEATLRRFWQNHPADFTVPEMRHIRAVVLSPATVARTIDVSDAAVRAAYRAQAATLVKPERRSAEIVTANNRAVADTIASFWRGGAQWAQVQALSAKDGAIAVALPGAAADEFPSAGLGRAVFASARGAITGPLPDGAGFVVLDVTAIVPGSGSYDAVRDQLRQEIAERQASAGMADRVDRLQDAIAGGGLDKIPADIGADAVEGSLDAKGTTPDGGPAPIPGTPALRDAVIAAAFATKVGDAPRLRNGPDHGSFAVSVERVTPAHRQTFDEALPEVIRLWHRNAVRREAETAATAIYARARADHALGAAASTGGFPVATPPPFRRGGPSPGVPAPLVRVAFGLRKGDATMVETPDGFAVAVLTGIIHPSPDSDSAAFGRLSNEVLGTIADDLEVSMAAVLTRDSKPNVNMAALNRLIGP